jgi:hypothetical protein
MVRNEQILRDVLLKMNYDSSKTLNENIQEQMGEKPFMTPRGMTYDENLKALGKDGFKDVDLHSVLGVIEIGTMIIAPFTGPAAPFLYGVSIAAGMADAALYYREGDSHSALMMAALTIIPEGKLIGKGIKSLVAKYGRKGVQELIEKSSKGAITSAEKKSLQEAMKDIAENGASYSKLLKVSAKQTIKSTIKNKPLRWLAVFSYNLSKLGFNIGVNVAGPYIGADKLYLHYYGDDEDRQKSEIRQIADMVANFSGEIYNKLLGRDNEVIDEVPDDKLTQLNKIIVATEKKVREPSEVLKDNLNVRELTKVFGKTLGLTGKDGHMFKVGDDVLTFYSNGRYFVKDSKPEKKGDWKIANGGIVIDGKQYGGSKFKQNTLTPEDVKNGKGVVKFGDKGDVVKYIQTELDGFGYEGENGEPIFKGSRPDGVFGKKTLFALKNYQKDYGIKDDGIVGKETMSAIMDI